jgi:hypothetical protein
MRAAPLPSRPSVNRPCGPQPRRRASAPRAGGGAHEPGEAPRFGPARTPYEARRQYEALKQDAAFKQYEALLGCEWIRPGCDPLPLGPDAPAAAAVRAASPRRPARARRAKRPKTSRLVALEWALEARICNRTQYLNCAAPPRALVLGRALALGRAGRWMYAGESTALERRKGAPRRNARRAADPAVPRRGVANWAAAMASAHLRGREVEFEELAGPAAGGGSSKDFVQAAEAALVHVLVLHPRHRWLQHVPGRWPGRDPAPDPGGAGGGARGQVPARARVRAPLPALRRGGVRRASLCNVPGGACAAPGPGKLS